MFKKLLKKKSMAQNIGDSRENNTPEADDSMFLFVIVKDNESEYSAKLLNKTTIGSEVGELKINHEQISPRHCTVFINRDVYSIIDHSSISGTFINKKRLDPGKIYLLDSEDKIRLGGLDLFFEQREPGIDPDLIAKAIPEVPVAVEEIEDGTRDLDSTVIAQFRSGLVSGEKSGELVIEELDDEDFSGTEINRINIKSDEHQTIIAKKMPFIPKSSEELLEQDKKREENKKTTKKKKIKVKKVGSSNSLIRVIANLNDFLFTYLFLNIASAFVEPKLLLEQVTADVIGFFFSVFDRKIELILKALPEIEQYKDFLFTFSYYIIFFALFKSLCSFLFGSSLGQITTGIKVEGSFIWKRVIAPFRVVLGILLFPFLIFDVPTIFSKRSFKEVITRTIFTCRGGLLSFLIMVLVTLLLIVVVIISPLFKGFEVLSPVNVLIDNQKGQTLLFDSSDYIKSLNLSVERSSIQKQFFPFATLRLAQKKKFIDIGLMGVDKDSFSTFKIRKLKTFSFFDIFKSFVALNPAAGFFYPEISGLVTNIANRNKSFKLNIQNKEALIREISKLIKSSYELDLASLPGFIPENGIFLSAYRDFREKISSLYELAPESLQIVEFGQRFGIEGVHGRGKFRYTTFIPIGTINGSFYRIDGNWNSIKLKEMKSHLHFGRDEGAREDSHLANFINLSQKSIVKDNAEINQSLYADYFELSQWALESENKNILEVIKKSLNQFINILNLDDKSNQKLVQNFSELLQALRNEDFEFFSLSVTETI